MNDGSVKRAIALLDKAEKRIAALERAKNEPIAIVGMGCRMPGGVDSPEALWRVLDGGVDAIRELPPERYGTGKPPSGGARWAGTTGEVGAFDPAFFGISPREAPFLDPQHRLLLEVAWEALEHASIAPDRLVGSKTGVFVGVCTQDYRDALVVNDVGSDGYVVTGTMLSAAGGRLSYTFGFQGPCVTLDTACSSSLVTIHLAAQALRAGDADLALAGGVNLILSTLSSEALGDTQALSPDGRCKTFDARADGYVRGEGCGVVVLKRLSDALRDGDRVWAVVRGSAVNQDGRSSGLTAPNVLSQEALLRRAYEVARVSPADVSYVEAHGTGTSLGDPIEVEALKAVLGAPRPDGSICALGSVKTNIGHLEAAAGVAGVMKVVLAMQHERIPRHLHFRTLNPRISLAGTPLVVASKEIPWPAGGQRRIAGVSSFGMTGTNAHVVLEEPPAVATPAVATTPSRPAHVFVLSAHSEAALRAQAKRLADHVTSNAAPLGDVAHTLATGRAAFEHRAALVARSHEELATELGRLAAGETAIAGAQGGTPQRPDAPQIVFLYSGQGTQSPGMGRLLDETQPVYRAALDRCAAVLDPLLGRPLREILYQADAAALDRTAWTQPALFAVEVALTELWRSWGIVPDAVLGHSVGEYAAAWAAGVFSLEDGCRLIAERARRMGALPEGGAMIAVRAEAARLAPLLEGHANRVAIAAINGPRSVVLSGEAAAIRAIGSALEADGIEVKALRVSHAFHSPLMDPMLEDFERVVRQVTLTAPRIPLAANVSGALSGAELTDPAYWREQIRRPVQFARGVRTLAGTGGEVFVEIGPHPALLGLAAENIDRADLTWVPSLRRGKDDTLAILEAVARLFVAGVPLDWRGFDAPWSRRRVVLPTYAFQRERHWHSAASTARGPQASAALPPADGGPNRLHGRRLYTPARERQHLFEVSVARQRFLADHKVYDALVVPGSYWIATMLSAADELLEGQPVALSDVLLRQALVLASDEESRAACVVLGEGEREGEWSADAYTATPAKSDEPDTPAEWQHHGAGTARAIAALGAAAPLDVIKARCTTEVDVAALYARIGATRIFLGEGFQWIRWIARGPREALARLERPASVPAEQGPLHPAQLDACFQALASSIDEGEGGVARVPFSIERIALTKWAGDVLWVHGTWGGDLTGDTVRFEGRLYDGEGALVGEIVGLTMKVAPKDALLQARKAAWSDWTYELAFRPRPLPAAGVFHGTWLLFDAAKDGVAEGLAAGVAELGGDTRVVALDRGDDAASAIAGAAESLAGVVIVETNAGDDASAVETRGLRALVAAAPLLGRRDDPARSARLVVVTRGALAAGAAPTSPAGALLAGAVRVAAQEHPDLRPVAIDLDPAADALPFDELLAELSSNDGEVQVALRGGERLAARLVRCRLPAKEARPFAVQQDGVHVIAGGLGGLGLRVARWLVERGARDLVLVGRKPAGETHAEALEALRRAGAEVDTVACDLSDADAVAALFARLSDRRIDTVVHAAGVLDDGVLVEQDAARFRRVLASKVDAARHLAAALYARSPSAQLVLFSSLSAVLGTIGQASYAAANAYLDALAHRLRGQGRAAVAVDWGAWREVGMAARLDSRDRQRLVDVGLGTMPPDDAIGALEDILGRDVAQVVVAPADWARVAARLRVGAVIEELVPASARRGAAGETTPLVRRLDQAEGKARREILLAAVKEQAARVLGLSGASAVDEQKPLQALGMDSLMAVEVRDGLGRALGRTLPATLVFDHPSVDRITDYLLQTVVDGATKRVRQEATKTRTKADEPIAIVGLACRFPGGSDSPEAFWSLLVDGVDAVSDVPKERWDVDAIYDPDPDAPGKTYSRWGAFLRDVDAFDARLFGIAPREALALDPQQRLLLEVAWEAFEDTNVAIDRLVGSQTGVFIGICFNDYARLMSDAFVVDPYSATGNAFSVAAGRLSYVFGLQGPCVPIETACSSSLVAIHLACQAIRNGECDTAIAGGVNLILSPEMTMYFSRLHAMSKDGRCKTFDASANGYVRGEGCGMVVLKPLSKALADGDRIHAVVRGSAVNQDGRSNGLTAPNGPAQEAVIRRALAQANLEPSQIGYVETHGTGTPLGDPIEVQALGAALGEGRPEERPLVIGSVKTNIGHTEGAAGVASVIKAILALKHGTIPPSLHFKTPNPHIPWGELPVRVASEAIPWPRDGQPRRAGVSSFGISGTNAHVVLEDAPEAPAARAPSSAAPRPRHLLVVSGHGEGALRAQASRLAEHLAAADAIDLGDVGHALAVGRTRLEHRAAVVAVTAGEAISELRAIAAAGEPSRASSSLHAASGGSRRPKVAFLFTGQGAQHPGMGRLLDETQPVYRAAIDRCAAVLDPILGRPLRDVLYASDAGTLERTELTQPALFAVEYALAELWKSWGIEPDAVLGHSVGEYAAACVAGVFSLEDGLRLIAERGRLMQALPEGGTMITVRAPLDRVAPLVAAHADRASIAAHNGPHSVVVSGAKGAVDAIAAALAAEGIESKALRVSQAFHSPLMDPMLDAFEAVVRKVPLASPRIPLAANVEGAISDAVAHPAYWRRHVREAVRFEEGLRALVAAGCDLLVEIGPHPALCALAAEMLPVGGETIAVASLRRGHDDVESILGALGVLWTRGADVDWRGFDAPWARTRVTLPTYAFQRERFWYTPTPKSGAMALTAGVEARFHGVRLPTPGREQHYLFDVGTTTRPYLADHKVYGAVVVPGAFFVTAALTSAAEVVADAPFELADLAIPEPLLLDGAKSTRVQLVVAPEDARGDRAIEIASPDAGGAWRSHVTCTLRMSTLIEEDHVDVEAIASRLPEAIAPAEFYGGAARFGFELGARFQWIASVRRGDREVLARLEAPPGVEPEEAPVHPTLLDACFQTMGLALSQGEKTDEPQARVPFSLERLRLRGRWDGPVWVHATWGAPDAEGTIRTEGRVYDAEGLLVGVVEGLRFKPARREHLLASRSERRRAPAYERVWHEVAARPSEAATAPGLFAVVDDGRGLATAIAAALEAQGGSAIVVPANAIEQLETAEKIDGIVVLATGIDEEAPAADEPHGWGVVLVAAKRAASATARFVVVTRAAEAVVASDRARPASALVGGLARVVAQECPELRPLHVDLDPHSTSLAADAAAIVSELARGAHVAWREGKRYEARIAPCRWARKAARTFTVDSEATYLVTGGLGGLGLEVAGWLARHGARHLVLAGRRSPQPAGAGAIAALEASGVSVRAVAIDVSQRDEIDALLGEIAASGHPLRGVVHAAGVLDDAMLAEQTTERIRAVLAPKVEGARHLDALTRDLPLDLFVLFSSLSSVLGGAGQAGYAAANAWLDALAMRRHAEGRPALAVSWGTWARVGMAVRMDARDQQRLTSMGLHAIEPEEALAALDEALARDVAHVVVARTDWSRIAAAPALASLLADVASTALAPKAAAATDLLRALEKLDGRARRDRLMTALREHAARVLGLADAAQVDPARPLGELGLDSLMAVELRNAVSKAVGKTLPATLVFDHPTLDKIAEYLLTSVLAFGETRARATATRTRGAADEPIAIVGVGCRFPGGANDPEAFWSLLRNATDAITEVPRERWDIDAYYDADPDAAGKMTTKWGGFIQGVDAFDAAFFGISPPEADAMDPQHRLLLETSWEALENAGYAPDRLVGSSTGVFVGICFNDYSRLARGLQQTDPYTGMGSAFSVAAGRISYVLGFEGPCMAIDTACSSSLVTIHLACQALRAGECDLALAGGVNLMFAPETTVYFSRLRAMAPDGRCKTFDASANGYVRGEGCGVVALKRLSKALADGDRILALVRGTAVNQDGRSNGLTAPSGPAQEAVIRRALAQAGAAPDRVTYVEAHGTGTPLGDPIELQALGAALGEGRPDDRPLLVGSVKTNIGHTEGAAGVAGVLKVVLSLMHEELPPSLHFRAPNPHVAWDQLPVRVVTEVTPWPRSGPPRLAGVSSFGMSGTNAHVLLEEAPPPRRAEATAQARDRGRHLLVLSARSATGLEAHALRIADALEARAELALADVGYTLAVGRTRFEHRASFVAAAREEAIVELRRIGRSDVVMRATTAIAAGEGRARPKIAFVFTGQGSQHVGMGQLLDETQPAYRAAIDRCAVHLDRLLGRSLRDVLYATSDEALADTALAQPAIFVVEYALTELWRAWGIEPDVVLGHSIGEITAAHVAGVMSLEDALRLVVERGRLMSALPDGGGMLAVSAASDRLADLFARFEGAVDVAAYNAPKRVVLSGDRDALDTIAAELTKQGIATKPLRVSHAFHSHRMDPMLDAFEEVLRGMTFHAPRIPLASNLTGTLVRDEVTDPAYWRRHVREPVRFAEGMRAVASSGIDAVVEVGPHASLLPMIAEILPLAASTLVVSSMRRENDAEETLLAALGGLWTRGAEVDWGGFEAGRVRRRVALPTYAFQRRRHWFDGDVVAAGQPAIGDVSPLEGRLIETPGRERHHVLTIDVRERPYLADHVFFDHVIAPGSYFIAAALAAARDATAGDVALEDVVIAEPLVLAKSEATAAHLVIGAEEVQRDSGRPIEIVTAGMADVPWRRHLAARVRAGAFVSVAGAETLDAVRARCATGEDVTTFYDRLASSGAPFGPHFQVLTELRRGSREALVRFAPPPGQDGAVHPLVVEACMQAVAFALTAAGAHRVYMPFAIERIDLDRSRALGWAHVTWASAPTDTFRADVRLYDGDGALAGEAKAVRLRAAPRIGVGATNRAVGLTYDVEWRAAPEPTAVGARVGRVLVVGGAGGLTDALAARLKHAEAGVVRVDADANAVRAAFAGHAPFDAIVHLGAIALDFDMREGAARGIDVALAIAQGVASDVAPRLVFVTRGAVAAAKGDTPRPAQAMLAAFRRVVAQEQRAFRAASVDLDPGRLLDVNAAAEQIAFELASAEEGREIVYRDGVRLAPCLVRRAARAESAMPDIRSDATYLVTGGTSGLGLATARWLVDCGAKHVVLASRRGAPPADSAEGQVLAALSAAGADVSVVRVDVARRGDLVPLVDALGRAEHPLRGVFHAAGVLDDGLLTGQTEARIAGVLAPKALAAEHLDALTRDLPLDMFVLFSSVSATFGWAGQSGYAAANGYLDALAARRRAEGLPALSVAFGPWAEIGMAARLDETTRKLHEGAGLAPLAPAEALAALADALSDPRPNAMIARLDPARLANAGVSRALLADLLPRSAPRADAELARKLAKVDPARRRDLLIDELVALTSHVSAIPTADIDPARPLLELGLTSLVAVQLRDLLSRRVGVQLPATLVFDHGTIERIAEHLLKTAFAEAPATSPKASAPAVGRAAEDDPIVIVGMACRFPGGVKDPDDYWRILHEGREVIREIPKERWDIDALYDPRPGTPGKMCTRWGGIVDGVDRFDAAFFSIPAEEAERLDPQQRLVLELSWEALENAAINVERLSGTPTGVFVGMMFNDYARLVANHEGGDVASLVSQFHMAAGLVSFALGFNGPAMAVDTACSSSLVALHLASQAIRNGECEMALAAGVNLMLAPESMIAYSSFGLLSPTGHVRSFDAAADGYVRSDGAGVVVLKRMSKALANGDRILAVVRGTAVNQRGRGSGMTTPSGPAQEEVIRRALAAARVTPADIDYVEAHGTATPFGDVIELNALGAVFSRARAADRPLLIGSAKPNIGYAESASGMASLIKVILAMHNEELPPNVNFMTPNPQVPWSELPLKVVTEKTPWPRRGTPRRAGVSAFGISGTNAHIIVEEPPPRLAIRAEAEGAKRRAQVILVSGKTRTALATNAQRLAAHFAAHPDLSLDAVARTLSAGRVSHAHRAALVVSTIAEARASLERLAAGPPGSDVHIDVVGRRPRVGMIVGEVPLDVVPALHAAFAPFRLTLAECASILEPRLGRPLDAALREVATSKGAIAFGRSLRVAVAIAAVSVLRAAGIAPVAAAGVGDGDFVAAWLQGDLPLEDALAAAMARDAGEAVRSMPSPERASGTVAEALNAVRAAGCDRVVLLARDRHAVGDVVSALGTDTTAADVALLDALAALHVVGAPIDWSALEPSPEGERVALPTYPFERRRHWLEASARGEAVVGRPLPVLAHLPDVRIWDAVLDPARAGALADVRVDGLTVAGLGSALLLAASTTAGHCEVHDVVMTTLLVVTTARGGLQTIVTPASDGRRSMQVFYRATETASWLPIAQATVGLPRAAALGQVDIEALCARPRDPVDPAVVRARAASTRAGAERLVTVHYREDDWLARLEPLAAPLESLRDVVRVALDVLAASAPVERAAAVPVATHVRRAVPVTGTPSWAHVVKRRNSGVHVSVDVKLLDDKGRVVAVLEELDVTFLDVAELRARALDGDERARRPRGHEPAEPRAPELSG